MTIKLYLLLACGFSIAGCGGTSAGIATSSSASSSSSSIVNVFRDVEVAPMFTTPFDTNGITRGEIKTYLPDESGNWAPVETYPLTSNGTAQVSLTIGRTYLLEFKGGCYVDSSFDLGGALTRTPTTICMSPSDMIRAVVVADNNINHISVTIFTEIAAGLALHDQALGATPLNAITHANAVVSAWVQTDILATQPATFDSTTVATPASNYAALILGFGTWLKQSSQALGGGRFGITPYTPSSVATLAGVDVQADGILDGLGNQGSLAVGTLPLSTNIYRHQFAAYGMRSMRWLYDPSNANRRGVAKTFIPQLLASNNSTDQLFGNAPILDLDEGGPFLSDNSIFTDSAIPQSLDYQGVVNIDDVVGIPVGGIKVFVDDELYDQPLVPFLLGLTHYSVNSTIFRNGNHKITLSVTNYLGTITSQSATMKFQNNCAIWPRACL